VAEAEVAVPPKESISDPLTFASSLSSLSSLATEAGNQLLSRVTRSLSVHRSTASSTSLPTATVNPKPPSPILHLVPLHKTLANSDTDDDFSPPSNMSRNTSVAAVEQANAKVPPSLTSGSLSPEILYQWERAANNFFRVKGVPKTDQVISVIYELKDPHIAAWTTAGGVRLETLTFAEFMEEF
jgi:hypothetical protein